jgi:multidrug efflux pump subunit AcrA (membrane-fusion protein)
MRLHLNLQTLLFFLLMLAISLSGCNQISPAEATPASTPTIADATDMSFLGANVVASGAVAPASIAHLSFDRAGRVQHVNVTEDEDIEVGQILAQLEGQETLEAAVIAAELELLAAQQDLQALIENADLARAQALQAVEDAQDALDSVEDDFAQERAVALRDISVAEEAVREAKHRLYYFTLPLSQSGFDTLEGIEAMTEALDLAREAYEPYKYDALDYDQVDCLSGFVGNLVPEICRQKTARQQLRDDLENAEGALNTAVRRLALEVDLANAEVDLEKALKKYESLGDGPGEADIALLEAQLAAAQREYESLKEGPDPDSVAMAEARLKNAEAQLEVARIELERISLSAPISGSAASVDIIPGDTVLTGQVVITLADLSKLHVETTDLSERDVVQVSVGQDVMVYIEALDIDVPGSVARISPQAEVVGGDVVYTVVIELDDQPPDLRWGMTVEVTFEQE